MPVKTAELATSIAISNSDGYDPSICCKPMTQNMLQLTMTQNMLRLTIIKQTRRHEYSGNRLHQRLRPEILLCPCLRSQTSIAQLKASTTCSLYECQTQVQFESESQTKTKIDFGPNRLATWLQYKRLSADAMQHTR